MNEIFRIGERFRDLSGSVYESFAAELAVFVSESDRDVVLDFSGVETLSSLALAEVGRVHLSLSERGRSVRVEGLSLRLYRLFEMSGLSEIVEVVPPPSEPDDAER